MFSNALNAAPGSFLFLSLVSTQGSLKSALSILLHEAADRERLKFKMHTHLLSHHARRVPLPSYGYFV